MTRPYPPPFHVSEDEAALIDIIRRFPFATFSSAGDPPAVSHMPAIWADGGEGKTLWTHIDRANPQTEALNDRPVTAVFHGVNSYMSPELFEGAFFPTWNYVVVECAGTARLIETEAGIRRILDASASAFETLYGKGFSLAGQKEKVGSLIPYICGVEITVERMSGRVKLAQDRPEPDRERALEALDRRPGWNSDFHNRLRRLAGL